MTSLLSAAPAVVLALWFLPASQDPPDFSGTWAMDLDRSESPHQGASFEPVTYVIAQSPTEVVIETRRGSAVSRATYPLLAAAAPDRAGKPGAARAFWEGTALVTEGTRVVQGQTVSVRETRSLDAAGAEMTVRTLLVVQHGYTFKGAQNYGAATDVYRRVVAPRARSATVAAAFEPTGATAASRRSPAPGPQPR
jgi:hypothetical protein